MLNPDDWTADDLFAAELAWTMQEALEQEGEDLTPALLADIEACAVDAARQAAEVAL